MERQPNSEENNTAANHSDGRATRSTSGRHARQTVSGRNAHGYSNRTRPSVASRRSHESSAHTSSRRSASNGARRTDRSANRNVNRAAERAAGRATSRSANRDNEKPKPRQSRTAGDIPAQEPSAGTSKGLPVIAIALVAVLVAAIALAVFVLGQNSSTNVEASSSAASTEVPNSSEAQEAKLEPDTATLKKLLGKETANKLVKQAEENQDAAWIAANVKAFAVDGKEVQTKILKLAAEEPKALPYVRQFVESYPEKKADMNRDAIVSDSDFKKEFKTKVPHLFQWDNRWGQTVYSSTTFGLTGCGPTSMAMVYQAITGKTDLSPYDMAELAQEGSYMAEFNGTGSGFFYYIAAQNDFSCTDLPISGESITEALRAGKIIIANLAEGYFTDNGHFFVLAGLSEDGKVIINDPYSYERSTTTWDADFIANESMALFCFSNDPYPWDGNAWSSGTDYQDYGYQDYGYQDYGYQDYVG